MPFLKRLGFYLFGLAIGLIFLAIFLKKKSTETGVEFCYFPNCRVLKDLRSKPIHYSGEIHGMFDDQSLDTLDIEHFLTEGNIDFGKSNTESTPCKTYYIEATAKERSSVLEVENCPDRVSVIRMR